MNSLLGLLLSSYVLCANAQIVFPDQLPIFQSSQGGLQQAKAPFPTLPSNFDFNDYNAPTSAGSSGLPHGIRQHDEASQFGFADSARAPAEPGPLGGVASMPIFTSEGNAEDAEAQYWSNHVNNLIARGVTKFSLDMDRAIHRTQNPSSPGDKDNIIFSPLSLVGTLAMVLLGSAGVTFDEVSRILGFESGVDVSSHSEIVHQMFGLLLDKVEHDANFGGPRANIASGVFVQTGYPIRPEFKAIGQSVYKNEIINLDFAGQSNAARQAVNDWVKARTNGKITGILTQQLDPDTKVILASALYFSGEWHRHFIKGATKRKPFMVTPTQTVTVDMMYTGGDFPFYEDKQLRVKIAALPYKGYDTSYRGPGINFEAFMYVLLPTSRDEQALSNLKNRLSPEVINGLIRKMANQTCILGLPRMKLSSNLNLNEPLNSLGLSSLFDRNRSNLGLLSPGRQANGGPDIFTRIGGDDNQTPSTTSRTVKPGTKNNYFRYEDKKGGYLVKQWDSGVIIEKIRRSLTRRAVKDAAQEARNSYQIPNNSTDRVRVVAVGEDKYKFARTKRQSRPIDGAFVRFLQNRGKYSKFGLDTLRNSNSVGNPGLFASDVLHKVEMDVTETGTVGAAATSVVLQRGGDIKRLVADRPFLFFIRHEPSKLLLFWGTVNKPTPNY